MKVRDYKELKVWQRSFELTKEIYLITKRFPEDEKYGLTSQIRRAAVSVPSNIAEGANRGSTKEFIRFLYIAIGSSAELESQLLLVEELGFLNKSICESKEKLQEVIKMLHGLIRSLKRVEGQE
ncbi:MAG: four helix bundle protein [Verrucomicrobia bacterium]|nr:four helix bundle protein [Verrucomicrobiota bacterium]